MASIGTVCGKIQPRKIKKGVSYSLLLVHNFRNRLSGKAEADLIAYFGTVRSYDLPRRAPAMWRKILVILDGAVARGAISASDARRAKAKFEKVLGSPPAKLPMPTAARAPKQKLTPRQQVLARLMEMS